MSIVQLNWVRQTTVEMPSNEQKYFRHGKKHLFINYRGSPVPVVLPASRYFDVRTNVLKFSADAGELAIDMSRVTSKAAKLGLDVLLFLKKATEFVAHIPSFTEQPNDAPAGNEVVGEKIVQSFPKRVQDQDAFSSDGLCGFICVYNAYLFSEKYPSLETSSGWVTHPKKYQFDDVNERNLFIDVVIRAINLYDDTASLLEKLERMLKLPDLVAPAECYLSIRDISIMLSAVLQCPIPFCLWRFDKHDYSLECYHDGTSNSLQAGSHMTVHMYR